MTPKEKAEVLVLKFEQYSDSADERGFAIKCALIAVDEILNNKIGGLRYNSDKQFWKDVKKEIKNL
jgi:hypothetical protein